MDTLAGKSHLERRKRIVVVARTVPSVVRLMWIVVLLGRRDD